MTNTPTDTDLIRDYDASIRKIALTVSGRRPDRLEDLQQIGRITLLKCWHNQSNAKGFWAWASTAIRNRMLDHIMEDTTVRVPRRSQARTGKRAVSTELPEDITAPTPRDATALADLLSRIEADIEALPEADRKQARAYMSCLEGHKTGSGRPAGKSVFMALCSRYRSEALALLSSGHSS